MVHLVLYGTERYWNTSIDSCSSYLAPCSLFTAPCSCSSYLAPCSLFTAPCSCSLCLAPCSLFTAPCSCSLCLAPCSLFTAPCSLCLAPCLLLNDPCLFHSSLFETLVIVMGWDEHQPSSCYMAVTLKRSHLCINSNLSTLIFITLTQPGEVTTSKAAI